jgi:lysophospholipase
MFEINTKPYEENIARLLTNTLVRVGQGTKYAPGKGPYVRELDTFERNDVTHSKERFEMNRSLFLNFPELALGGPTNRWVQQSLKTTKRIETIAGKIQIPMLILQAENDLVVKPGRQRKFCQRHSNCRLVKFNDAYHEILMEKDLIRDEALRLIKDFIQH